MFRSGGCGSKGVASQHLVQPPSPDDHLASLPEQAFSMGLAMNADDVSQTGREMLSGLQEFEESQSQPENYQELLGGFNLPQPAVGPA